MAGSMHKGFSIKGAKLRDGKKEMSFKAEQTCPGSAPLTPVRKVCGLSIPRIFRHGLVAFKTSPILEGLDTTVFGL